MRQIRQRADIRAAVPAVALVQLFGFEVAAECGFDFFAGQPLFDVMMRRPRQWRGALRRRWRIHARTVDRSARRAAAESASCSCKSLIRLFFARIAESTRPAAKRSQAVKHSTDSCKMRRNPEKSRFFRSFLFTAGFPIPYD